MSIILNIILLTRVHSDQGVSNICSGKNRSKTDQSKLFAHEIIKKNVKSLLSNFFIYRRKLCRIWTIFYSEQTMSTRNNKNKKGQLDD